MPDSYWRCSACEARHPLRPYRYLCDCAEAGRLELAVDDLPARAASVRAAARDRLWRYAALLPPLGDDAIDATAAVFPAGGTPLLDARRLAERLGPAELWIKDEGANPTGSLKDRASAVVVASALHSGSEVVATASSGNAATALAAAAAAGGIPCVVFVPGRTPGSRIARLQAYGAHVLVIDGDYETAVGLGFAACDEWGWLCRTSAVNPYTTQGKKTVALEIAEQLGGRGPDVVVVPAGDGNILVGLYLGFREAHAAGWIGRLPRLIAVQAAGAQALHRAWRAGAKRVAPARADTVAAGIRVARPLDGARALAAVRATNGAVVVVDDPSILDAVRVLARDAGVSAEPSSAAAAAALPDLVARGLVGRTDRVVLINTGGGRDAPEVAGFDRIPPTLDAVRQAVGDLAQRRGGTSKQSLSAISVT